jgi:hypothetical protein
VTRRPDSETIFRQVGRSLTGELRLSWRRRILPTKFAFALARRRLVSTVRNLFGERFTQPIGAPFQFEARVGPLLEVGSGGHPCLLVTGIAENILGGYRKGPHIVVHPSCRGRGDDRCLWTLVEAPPPHLETSASETPVPLAPTSDSP